MAGTVPIKLQQKDLLDLVDTSQKAIANPQNCIWNTANCEYRLL